MAHQPRVSVLLAAALVLAGCAAGGPTRVVAELDTPAIATESAVPTPTVQQSSPLAQASPSATALPAASEAVATVTDLNPTEVSSTADAPALASTCPDVELLADAVKVHPSIGNEVIADFDGDGIDDQIWVATNEAEASMQVVRSSDSAVSQPLETWLGWSTMDGVLAGADIDGDGRDEVFYSMGGNTALTGLIVELDGCALTKIAWADPDPMTPVGDLWVAADNTIEFIYDAFGNSCAPTGCHHRIACDFGPGNGLKVTFTSVWPEESILTIDHDADGLSFDERPAHEWPVQFSQSTITVSNGVASLAGTTERQVVQLGDISEWTDRPRIDCR